MLSRKQASNFKPFVLRFGQSMNGATSTISAARGVHVLGQLEWFVLDELVGRLGLGRAPIEKAVHEHQDVDGLRRAENLGAEDSDLSSAAYST